MNNLVLAIWAATIPLMPYALLRRNHNLFSASTIVFIMLLINVFIMINTPNENNIVLIPVTAP